MTQSDLKPFVRGLDDMKHQIDNLSRAQGPTFFKLRAQLPVQGRTDTILAASPTMVVTLKTYARSGENAIHRHVNEDHAFVVLQGAAEFHGPRGERRIAGVNEGVLLPNTAYYAFRSVGEEPLVMLRVGARTAPGADILERVNAEDVPEHGFSEANKQVELILDPNRFFG
jgi:mannose-6-phosphate isomerase-like protein (cupin superfamily)